MSRLIKKPIMIETGASLTESNGVLTIKGPKGENTIAIPHSVTLKIEGNEMMVSGSAAAKNTAMQGTIWSLAKNALIGVTQGFERILEIEGVGYRAVVEGKELVLFLGYALPVRKPIPDTVTVTVDKNVIKVVGIDKDQVGRTAAEIRALKKPEPYKGKGIHYKGEVIRRKVGKKAGTGA